MEWWSSQLVSLRYCLNFCVWFSFSTYRRCTLNNNNNQGDRRDFFFSFFSKTLCTCRHWIRLTKPPAWQSLSSLLICCHLEWRQWSIMLQTLLLVGGCNIQHTHTGIRFSQAQTLLEWRPDLLMLPLLLK